MADSKIEWTDKTWSPIRARVKDNAREIALERGWVDLLSIVSKMRGHVGPHCEQISPGCHNCYSLTNNGRCLPNNGTGLPFDKRSRELVDIFVDEKILMQPLHWKAPKKIFVENQSDLFGKWVPFEMADKVVAVMALTPWHTYQVLTKRAERMLDYLSSDLRKMAVGYASDDISDSIPCGLLKQWPLPNCWLGVSAEDQKRADERIPLLLQTPAAVRFVSYEPALGPVDFKKISLSPDGDVWVNALTGQSYTYHAIGGLMKASLWFKLDWVIVGGESGPGARPFDLQWARDVRRQCKDAGAAFFMNQVGAVPIMPGCRQNHWDWGCRQNHWDWGGAWGHTPKFSNYSEHPPMWRVHLKSKKGGDMEEWPEDLRVRQFPDGLMQSRKR